MDSNRSFLWLICYYLCPRKNCSETAAKLVHTKKDLVLYPVAFSADYPNYNFVITGNRCANVFNVWAQVGIPGDQQNQAIGNGL